MGRPFPHRGRCIDYGELSKILVPWDPHGGSIHAPCLAPNQAVQKAHSEAPTQGLPATGSPTDWSCTLSLLSELETQLPSECQCLLEFGFRNGRKFCGDLFEVESNRIQHHFDFNTPDPAKQKPS